MTRSEGLSTAELRKAGVITSFEIVAAIDAYFINPNDGPFTFKSGHVIDVSKAVSESIEAMALMNDRGPEGKSFRNAVAIAVMTAKPIICNLDRSGAI